MCGTAASRGHNHSTFEEVPRWKLSSTQSVPKRVGRPSGRRSPWHRRSFGRCGASERSLVILRSPGSPRPVPSLFGDRSEVCDEAPRQESVASGSHPGRCSPAATDPAGGAQRLRRRVARCRRTRARVGRHARRQRRSQRRRSERASRRDGERHAAFGTGDAEGHAGRWHGSRRPEERAERIDGHPDWAAARTQANRRTRPEATRRVPAGVQGARIRRTTGATPLLATARISPPRPPARRACR